MRDVFRIFFSTGWKQQVAILMMLLASSAAELLGIAALWPILGIVSGEGNTKTHAIDQFVQRTLNALGLPISIEILLITVLFAAVLSFCLGTLGSVFVGQSVANFASELRLKLIDALVRTKWSYFVAQPVARFTAAISSEADRASAAYKSAGLCLVGLMQTIALMTMAVFVSWPFFLAAIAISALLWVAVGRYMKSAKKAGRGKSKHNLALLHSIIDALTNVKALKAMNRHRFVGHTFAIHIDRLRRATQAETYSASAMRAVQDPLFVSVLLGGLYAGHSFLGMDIRVMLGSTLLFKRIADSINSVRSNYQRVALDRGSYWQLQRVTKELQENSEVQTTGMQPPFPADISLINVSFSYPGRQVITHTDITLSAGTLTAAIGPSGAGKTTIADLIIGLLHPDSGVVVVGGNPIGTIDISAWRKQLGYVPQDSVLFNESIRHNVTLGDSRIPQEAVREALTAAGAWEFVSALPGQMDFTIGVRGSLLSGGQRQRVAIARALIGNPKLIIMDEATSALDHNTAVEIAHSAQALAGDRTVFAITHQALWVDAASAIYEVRNGYTLRSK